MTQRHSVWGLKRCCRYAKATAQRYFVSIRHQGLPGSLAYCRAISVRNGPLPVFSRRVRKGRCRRQPIWTRSANTIWRRSLNNNRMARITCWAILSVARWRTALPHVCGCGGKPSPSSACWIPGRRKRKTGQKKRPMDSIRKCWRRLIASGKPFWPRSRGTPLTNCLALLKGTTLMRFAY